MTVKGPLSDHEVRRRATQRRQACDALRDMAHGRSGWQWSHTEERATHISGMVVEVGWDHDWDEGKGRPCHLVRFADPNAAVSAVERGGR